MDNDAGLVWVDGMSWDKKQANNGMQESTINKNETVTQEINNKITALMSALML